MGLCKYRNVFGSPGEGVHARKLFGVAAVDLIMTIVVALIIPACFFRQTYTTFAVSFLVSFAALMISALVLHRLFCVDTVLTVAVFGRN